MQRKKWFLKGLREGLAIGAGYYAVSFTLGIVMRNAGMTPLEGFVMSLLNNTSAGELAGVGIIGSGGSTWEIVISQLVINLRYLLMSAALAMHMDPKLGIAHRMLVSFDVTDEVFALEISQETPFSPYYSYGAMLSTIPFWALGTLSGIVFGSLLPEPIVSALSVALYAMFIAVVIPPCKKDPKLLVIVSSSMANSFLFARMSTISFGMRVTILTIVLSSLFALLFPKGEYEA